MNPSTQSSLRITRAINAPRDRVYAAWTDAALAEQWWGAEGTTTRELTTDARVGRKFQWVLSTPESGKITAGGVYQEVLPGEKLAFTWAGTQDVTEDSAESLVTVEFCGKEGGITELHLSQNNFSNEESRDNHEKGWNSALDNLECFLKK